MVRRLLSLLPIAVIAFVISSCGAPGTVTVTSLAQSDLGRRGDYSDDWDVSQIVELETPSGRSGVVELWYYCNGETRTYDLPYDGKQTYIVSLRELSSYDMDMSVIRLRIRDSEGTGRVAVIEDTRVDFWSEAASFGVGDTSISLRSDSRLVAMVLAEAGGDGDSFDLLQEMWSSMEDPEDLVPPDSAPAFALWASLRSD